MSNPKYLVIANDLRERIESGEFRPGDPLPGIGSLMSHYQVSGLNTVRSAQQRLREEGYITTVPGKGSYVLKRPVPADNSTVLLQTIDNILQQLQRTIEDAQSILSRARSYTAGSASIRPRHMAIQVVEEHGVVYKPGDELPSDELSTRRHELIAAGLVEVVSGRSHDHDSARS